MSITMLAEHYIPSLHVENKVLLDLLPYFHGMHCLDFVENASFKVLVTLIC